MRENIPIVQIKVTCELNEAMAIAKESGNSEGKLKV